MKFKWFSRKVHQPRWYSARGIYSSQRVLTIPTSPHKEIMLAEKRVYIVADETTGSCQRNVLVTLAIPEGQGKSYVIGVDFLTRVNHSSL